MSYYIKTNEEGKSLIVDESGKVYSEHKNRKLAADSLHKRYKRMVKDAITKKKTNEKN